MLLALLVSFTATAEVYKWVDEEGHVTYSDHPREGSEQVVLPRINSYRAVVPSGSAVSKPTVKGSKAGYTRFDIIKPASEENLQNTGGKVTVALLLQPGLQADDRIRLTLNGQPQPKTLTTTQFILSGIPRGTNTLKADVVNAEGSERIASKTITFYVHQHSVLTGPQPQGGGQPPSSGSGDAFAPNFAPNFQP